MQKIVSIVHNFNGDIMMQFPKLKAVSSNKKDPLFFYSEHGKAKPLKFLIETNAGIDLNSTDKEGYSPLFLAIINKHIEVIEILLKNGAHIDIDMKDKSGMTILDILNQAGYEEIKNICDPYLSSQSTFNKVQSDLKEQKFLTALSELKKLKTLNSNDKQKGVLYYQKAKARWETRHLLPKEEKIEGYVKILSLYRRAAELAQEYKDDYENFSRDLSENIALAVSMLVFENYWAISDMIFGSIKIEWQDALTECLFNDQRFVTHIKSESQFLNSDLKILMHRIKEIIFGTFNNNTLSREKTVINDITSNTINTALTEWSELCLKAQQEKNDLTIGSESDASLGQLENQKSFMPDKLKLFIEKLYIKLNKFFHFVEKIKTQNILTYRDESTGQRISNSVISFFDKKLNAMLDNVDDSSLMLLLQSISKAQAIELKNLLKNDDENIPNLKMYITEIAIEYQEKIEKIDILDISILARGIADKIVNYILRQKKPSEFKFKTLLLEGVVKGRANTDEIIKLRTVNAGRITLNELLKTKNKTSEESCEVEESSKISRNRIKNRI